MRVTWDGDPDNLDATYKYVVDEDGELTEAEAIAELDRIKPAGMGDNCHLEADAVLLSLVPRAVLDAYWRVNARERFHYS